MLCCTARIISDNKGDCTARIIRGSEKSTTLLTKKFALNRIYTVNTVSRLLGKTKHNSNVEKKLKTKLQGTFSLVLEIAHMHCWYKTDFMPFCS